MRRLKVMTVFGVRPEAVKMAPLIKELQRYPELIETVVVVTGQHREMLDQVLRLFDIEPDYDLNIMQSRQTLSGILIRALQGLEEVLKTERPDLVLVHGDTATTFAGSLAAFYQQISVGHVEAGLRTNNKYFPYPEEINRKLTGVLADLHFAPTDAARQNLLKEGVKSESIFVTGNTVIDALQYTIESDFVFRTPELATQPWRDHRMILVEVHRRENLGEPIREICLALRQIVNTYSDTYLVFPVHRNPAVREVVYDVLKDTNRVLLTEPLDTDEFHNLMAQAHFIISDSGGLQEEAPALGVPVLVARDVTERPEAVAAGTVKVVGTQRTGVFDAACELLTNDRSYRRMSQAINPYGDGRASARIVAAILYWFGCDIPRPRDFSPRLA